MEDHYFILGVNQADSDLSSICYIGLAEFKNSRLISIWESYINPQIELPTIQTERLKLKPELIRKSPTFKEIYLALNTRISGKKIFFQTAFCRVSILRICQKINRPLWKAHWLDFDKLAKISWPEYISNGLSIAQLSKILPLNSKSDLPIHKIILTGQIVKHAINQSRISLEESGNWTFHHNPLPNPIIHGKLRPYRNTNSILYGENIVFSGYFLFSIAKMKLYAKQLGCNIQTQPTKATTLFIQNKGTRLEGAFEIKAYKQRKVEELIKKGYPIRILNEESFLAIAKIKESSLKRKSNKLFILEA